MRNSSSNVTTLTYTSGAYNGNNLCPSGNFNCYEGYVLNLANELITQAMFSLSTIATTGRKNSPDSGALTQLTTCLKDNFPQLVVGLFEQNGNSTTLDLRTCATPQRLWKGWGSTGQLYGHFSSDTCNEFVNKFASLLSSKCENDWAAAGYNALYFLILLVLVPICAVVVLGCMGRGKRSSAQSSQETAYVPAETHNRGLFPVKSGDSLEDANNGTVAVDIKSPR